jgi:hypothetical protein
MTGDIVQDGTGWFFHVNADGTLHCLSSAIAAASPTGQLTTLVHNGVPTGLGDQLATRCAMILDRRYQ